jgi:diadenosine tetraphosphatase ApaH/serine/threonine PP2A family protein phosphatase
MRLALMTDIHANREAFEAVLADAGQRDIDRIAILGDLVGYGPDPEWCVSRVRALVEDGAICIQGNHDAAVADPSVSLNTAARKALDWTRARLDATQKTFLAGLPLTATMGETLLVHASANDPSGWIYVNGANRAMPSFRVCDARLIFCGHVHRPALMTCDARGDVRDHNVPIGAPIPLLRSRRWLAVLGAVGQPRDGSPAAGYAILDTATNELTFRRVVYDVAATARKVRAAGLPDSLADRLLVGR